MILAKVTRAAFDATSKLLHLQLRAEGDEGDDDTAVPVDDATYFAPFGLAIRPIVASTLRAFMARVGDEIAATWLVDRAKTPTDLAEGESRFYAVGKNTVRIRALAGGGIHVESDGGPINVTASTGQDVVVNGGTLKVARETDSVNPSAAITTWMGNVVAALGTLGQTVAAYPGTAVGTIGGGAARFKG